MLKNLIWFGHKDCKFAYDYLFNKDYDKSYIFENKHSILTF
jgi:hypothetical protein